MARLADSLMLSDSSTHQTRAGGCEATSRHACPSMGTCAAGLSQEPGGFPVLAAVQQQLEAIQGLWQAARLWRREVWVQALFAHPQFTSAWPCWNMAFACDITDIDWWCAANQTAWRLHWC